jgi:exopolysaccharide production protein ExoQ
MSPTLAAAAFALGIAGLFYLDRDPSVRTSKGLWVPVIWLLIAGSRNVSQWLAAGNWSAYQLNTTSYSEGSPLDRWVYTGLLFAGLAVLAARGPKVVRMLRANAHLLIYFGYCALSIAWSDFPDVSFKRWTKAVGDLAMVLIVLTDARPDAALKRLLARVGFVLLPVSVMLIKYFPDLGRTYDPGFGVWTPSFTGVTTNKNELGMIALVFGLGALWRFLGDLRSTDKHRLRRLCAQGVLLGIVGWILASAHSTTSTVCFIFGGSLIVASSMPRWLRKPALIHMIVLGILGVSVFSLFLDSSMVSTIGKDPTLTGRTDIWKLVLGLAGSPVVGTGFESFWLGPRLEKMWAVYWWHPIEAHDGYLEVYLNLGWVGLTLLGVMIVVGYRNALAVFRRQPQKGGTRIAYIVVALVYNMTESAIRVLNPVWLLFLMSITAVPESGPIARVKRKKVAALPALAPVAAPSLENV